MKRKELIALNAYLAQAGICSRRAAVDLIKKGRISVNDEIVTEPGYKVSSSDIVKYKDEIVKPEAKIYILLNKPKGFVTTLSDDLGRRNIMQLINISSGERLFPVGRLDRDTTGLILITNDGFLGQKLSHPRNKVSKIYYVVLDKLFNVELVPKLKQGVYLEDGKAFFDKANFAKGKGRNHLVVQIHGGKKRIIKRVFTSLGYKVTGLDRINYAGLTKKGLPVGRWRHLKPEEIQVLKNLK